MPGNSVCAIIVTHHPSEQHISNLDVLSPQVEKVVVVDNGSSNIVLGTLRKRVSGFNGMLIENGDNFGIAKALNIGVKWAITQEYSWIILFDQDSRVTDGFIEGMLSDMATQARARPVGQMIPQYRDPNTGGVGFSPGYSTHCDGPLIAITSGSLFPVSTFSRCGFFREELFIYCVDDDYSLRLNQSGLFIGISEKATLLHIGGRPTDFHVFGRKLFTYNYAPIIQYYWARNRVWLMIHYGWRYPQIIFSSCRSLVVNPMKIAIAETNRRAKISMFAFGALHGLVGRMGKRVL
jgi:rhamnosyltransferase